MQKCVRPSNIKITFLEMQIFNTRNIYTLPLIVSLETKVRVFQFKLLNNILRYILTKMLFRIRKINSLLCPFWTLIHLFCECQITNQLWDQIRFSFEDKFNFRPLTLHHRALSLD